MINEASVNYNIESIIKADLQCLFSNKACFKACPNSNRLCIQIKDYLRSLTLHNKSETLCTANHASKEVTETGLVM